MQHVLILLTHLDCTPGNVEQILSLHKDIIPEASLLMALHLGQVEVRTCISKLN